MLSNLLTLQLHLRPLYLLQNGVKTGSTFSLSTFNSSSTGSGNEELLDIPSVELWNYNSSFIQSTFHVTNSVTSVSYGLDPQHSMFSKQQEAQSHATGNCAVLVQQQQQQQQLNGTSDERDSPVPETEQSGKQTQVSTAEILGMVS